LNGSWEYNIGKPEGEKLLGHKRDDNIKIYLRGIGNEMKTQVFRDGVCDCGQVVLRTSTATPL
jgi:hypothetical protein